MDNLQKNIVILFALLNTTVFLIAYYLTKYKDSAHKPSRYLFLLGIFFWGDGVVLGLFWLISSLIVFYLNDWNLFLLLISVFWVVRSLGETIYWFNQQFSKVNMEPPEKMIGYGIFKNDSIWFAYQLMWQCVLVVSIIFTIYYSNKWLK